MRVYDETTIAARVARLSRRRRTAFAAACAERLLPLHRRIAEQEQDHRDLEALRGALTALWAAIDHPDTDTGVHEQWVGLSDRVRDDDEIDPWTDAAAYAQSAAIAVIKAVETFTEDDPRCAVWAARHVYEVADYAAQQLLEIEDFSEESQRRLAASDLVQHALEVIESDVDAAASLPATRLLDMSVRSREFGEHWSSTLP